MSLVRASLFLLVVLASPLARAIGDWAPNLTVTATCNDNLSNADRSSDRVGAFGFDAALSSSHRIGLSPSDALIFSGRIDAHSVPRFDALNHLTLGPAATLQRKFGLGPSAPILSLTAAVDTLLARDEDWRGLAGAVTVAWRQRLTDLTLLRIAQEFSRFDAKGALYDRTAAETSLNVTHPLAASWELGAVARLRFGDALSYATPPRPDLVNLARVREPEDTFDRPMVAYSFRARTLSAGLSLLRLLDDRTSLALAAEYRLTEKSALHYVNRLVSATLAHQF